MKLEDLKNPELQEKLKSAKTPEELRAIAEKEGLELSDEELENIAGGYPYLQTPSPPMPEGVIV